MHAKSDFLARIGHDLSTPLNAILGFAQVMEMELLGGAPDSKYLDYARNIRTSGEILSALISDILDLSRIEAGKLELQDEVFALAPLMNDIGMLFRGQAEAVEVDLVVETAGGVPDMRGDRKAVLQALMNLVSNAVKFTDAGGRITVTAKSDGNGLCLAVADTGAGFDMSELDIVLEPFGRAQQAPGHRRAGTGLGLAIAKALAELHDGALEIDSAPGVGTTAALLFPADRAVSGGAGRAAE
jgi:signal transduction histidine kinase